MTSRDGIGAPRKLEVVERDQKILKLIKQRSDDGECTRLSDVRRELGDEVSRSQAYYVLTRLRNQGLIRREAGYLWCLVDEG